MNIEDIFSGEKTTYSMRNEGAEKSTISIDKWAADLLQEMLPDVHSWIQQAYDKVSEKRSHLSRRQKGDLVRLMARTEAEKSPNYVSLIDLL